MNESATNKPKSRISKMLDESDARLLKALEEIEKEELKAETEPEEIAIRALVKEELTGHAKKMKEDGISNKEIKKMHPEVTDKDLEEEYIYETPVEKAPEPAIKYKTPLAEPLQEAFDGYKLFNDKNELFECNISIDGASLINSEARIIIESGDWDLVFKGNISSNGRCSIPIKKLSILPEGTRGKIKLEVIAEDTRFIPWEDRFLVKADKKVYVQIKEQKDNSKFFDKPSINVSGITQPH
jgi:hypothetical protein